MRRPRIFLDANVLVDAQIRDFFCRLAEAEVIDLHWSSRVLDELTRTLTEKLGLGPQKVARLVAALKHAFPGASVGGFTSGPISYAVISKRLGVMLMWNSMPSVRESRAKVVNDGS